MESCSLHCTPCRGGIPPLTPEAAQARRTAMAPDWQLNETATTISHHFKRANFREALALACQIGEMAEEEGHHPTLTVGWGFCRVEFMTHKIKGLHENDFVMAARVDALVNHIDTTRRSGAGRD